MEKLYWITEQRRVRELIPLDFNPRKVNEDKQRKLIESIGTFNLVEIPVINKDNRIIAGQRRYEALWFAGKQDEFIDVRVPNRMLTEDEVKRYNLISNTHAGEWDLEKLEEFFADIDYKDIICELPEISAELPSTDMVTAKPEETKEILEDEFDEGPVADPVTKPGDLYELNEHRLLCADSTDMYAVRRLMDGKLAQMVFTDPPYNVKVADIVGLGKIKHDEFKMASGEMNKSRFTRFLEDVIMNLIKYSKNGSIHYICMDWKHVNELSTAGKLYQEFKQLIIWVKDNGGMGTFYRSQHELIFVYKNGKGKHINNFELGQNGRYRTNVWQFAGMNSVGNKERDALEDHPTVKPVKLVADAMYDCSKEGNIILDLFLGSGTTIVAAEQTGRVCFGQEMDEKYCDTIIRRYLRFMKQYGHPVTIKRNGVVLESAELAKFL
ncbi:MAG: DNA modification methylase [Porphyromonadaceae bacterium]|nr:DNA modification methylase [Porphyromonadaceae bacterium]